MVKNGILSLIDFFYPPFRKIMPLQTFRYAACGGSNAVLGFLVFVGCHKYVFKEEQFDIGFYAFKSYNAALFVSFCVTFLVGFTLNKYLVFTSSNLKGRIQLFRYFLSLLLNLAINYILLKIFIEYLHFDAVLAQVITTFIIISISYLTQHHFSFKVKKSQDIKII
jgi:putative flippase GtrA